MEETGRLLKFIQNQKTVSVMNRLGLFVKVLSCIGLLSYVDCSNRRYKPFMVDRGLRMRAVNWTNSLFTLVYGSQRQEFNAKDFGLNNQIDILKASFVFYEVDNVILRTDDQLLYVYDMAIKKVSSYKMEFHSVVLAPPPNSKAYIQLQNIPDTKSILTNLYLLQRIDYDGTPDKQFQPIRLNIPEHTKWVTSGEVLMKQSVKGTKDSGKVELWSAVYTLNKNKANMFLMKVDLDSNNVTFTYLAQDLDENWSEQSAFIGADGEALWVRLSPDRFQAVDLHFASLFMSPATSYNESINCVDMASYLKGSKAPCSEDGYSLIKLDLLMRAKFQNFPGREYSGGYGLSVDAEPSPHQVVFTGLEVRSTSSYLYVSQCQQIEALAVNYANVVPTGCFNPIKHKLPGKIVDSRVYVSADTVRGYYSINVILPDNTISSNVFSIFPCNAFRTCHECEAIGYYIRCIWDKNVCKSGDHVVPPKANKCFQIKVLNFKKEEGSYTVELDSGVEFFLIKDILTIVVNGKENITGFDPIGKKITFKTSLEPETVRLVYRRTTGFECFAQVKVEPQNVTSSNTTSTNSTKTHGKATPSGVSTLTPTFTKKSPSGSHGSNETISGNDTISGNKTIPDNETLHLTTFAYPTTQEVTQTTMDRESTTTLAASIESSKNMMALGGLVAIVAIIALVFLFASRRKTPKYQSSPMNPSAGYDLPPIVTVKSNPLEGKSGQKSVTSLSGTKVGKVGSSSSLHGSKGSLKRTSGGRVSDKKSSSLTHLKASKSLVKKSSSLTRLKGRRSLAKKSTGSETNLKGRPSLAQKSNGSEIKSSPSLTSKSRGTNLGVKSSKSGTK